MFFMLLYYSNLLLENILIMSIQVGIFIRKTFKFSLCKMYQYHRFDSITLSNYDRYRIVLTTLNCVQSDSLSPHNGCGRPSAHDRTTGHGGRTDCGRGCCGTRRTAGNVLHLSSGFHPLDPDSRGARAAG